MFSRFSFGISTMTVPQMWITASTLCYCNDDLHWRRVCVCVCGGGGGGGGARLMWDHSDMPRTNTTWRGFWMSALPSHGGEERCIWKTWGRLIHIIRHLEAEGDCGCRRGFRTWYLLSCVTSQRDSLTCKPLCSVSGCFKMFKNESCVCLDGLNSQLLPKWLVSEFSDLATRMVKVWLRLSNLVDFKEKDSPYD